MLVAALWSIVPAYFANSSAVLWGGGPPIDLGRTLPDGRRVLGDGKTYRGLLGGGFTGVAVAILMNQVAPSLGMPHVPPAAALGLGFGALLGDISASFLKRRVGLTRGGMAPGLDQLDFLAGALLLTWLLAPDWFVTVFDLRGVLLVVLLTPVVHVSVNLFAYKVGLKEEPW